MTATITLPTHAQAKSFARAWSFYSLRGHTVHAAKADGETSVVLDHVTESDRTWIDAKVAELNSHETTT